MEQQKQDSLSNKNMHKQGIRITIAVVAGKIIGALVMHFLSSAERWIRL